MIRHDWQCGTCASVTRTEASITEAPVAPECCGAAMAKLFRAPNFMLRAGTPQYKPLALGRGRLHGISAEREVEIHRQNWKESAAMARAKMRSVRGSRRKDDEMRPLASVPIQLFASRVAEFGTDYWTAEPEKAVKREGVDFGS